MNTDPAGLKISGSSQGDVSESFLSLSKVWRELKCEGVEAPKLQMVLTNHNVVSSACWEGVKEACVYADEGIILDQ